MIVLDAMRDAVLRALQSLAEIVKRRHTMTERCVDGVLEDYEPNRAARAATDFFRPPIAASRKLAGLVNAIQALVDNGIGHGFAGSRSGATGFFSANKANLRNAP